MQLAHKHLAPPSTTTASVSVLMPNDSEQLARRHCQDTLTALVAGDPAVLFASVCLVDGRSYAHAATDTHAADPQRTAAIMSSLMGLLESFSRETLQSRALYTSLATEHGSIVIARVPSRQKMHALCVCSDASSNLAMTIRTTLDTAQRLAHTIDAGT